MMVSVAVAEDFADVTLPSYMVWLVPLFVAFSCLGSMNGTLLSSARFFFATGRNEQMPQIVGYVHYKYRTPLPAIIFIVVLKSNHFSFQLIKS